jgi:peptide/nickel transport system permease protein
VKARIAICVLVALAGLAAVAPLLANERPLAVVAGGASTFPAFAALDRADVFWAAAFVACLGMVLPRLGRAALVLLAALVAGFGAFAFEPRALEPPPPGARVFSAPVSYGPTNTDVARRLAGIGAPGHPLGTDDVGRDVLARLLHGLRLSLLVGFAATAVAVAAGVLLGVWAACGGRAADAIASSVVQTSFCVPAAFVVAAVQSFGPISLAAVILLLALLRFGTVARLVRQECLKVRAQPFVLAARGLGLHPLRVLTRHVLPNALVPVTVAAAFGVAGAILSEAGLSFLGLGVPERIPSLGRMLNDGRRVATLAPHLVVLPGLLILVLVLACHTVGAWLRDLADPRGAEPGS